MKRNVQFEYDSSRVPRNSDLLGVEIRFAFDSEPLSSVSGIGNRDDQIGRFVGNDPQFFAEITVEDLIRDD